MDATEGDTPRRYQIGPGASLKRAVTEANKLLADLTAADMATLGLTPGEADLLTVVHVADHAPAASEVADWLSLTGAGTTGRLKTLERRGLIERRPHPSDGRSITIHLTEAGAELASAVVSAKDNAVLASIIDRLGPDDVARLTDTLDALSAAIRETLPES